MTERKALWIFPNFLETINELPEKQRADVWKAICEYGLGCEIDIKKLKTQQRMAVKMLIPLLKLRNTGGSIKQGETKNPSGKNQFSSVSHCNIKKSEDNPYPNPLDNCSDNNYPNPEDNPLYNKNRNKNINKNLNLNKEKEDDFLEEVKNSPIYDAFRLWIDYKKERGQKYNLIGLKVAFAKLQKFSGGNGLIATDIINEAISNNWSGFFAKKTIGTRKTHAEEVDEHNLKRIKEIFDVDF